MGWEAYEEGAALIRETVIAPLDAQNTEGEPMTAEIVEHVPQSTAVVVSPQQELSPTLFGTSDPGAVITQATAVSQALMRVVRSESLAVNISGRDHLKVEAWTLMGSMVGVFPVVEWTRPVMEDGKKIGWEARVEARTRDGNVVGSAESMCLRSESTWKGRDDFALRSMAQTRATSKALATCLRFIAVLGGFAGTPADDMPRPDAPAAPGPRTVRETVAEPDGRRFREGDTCPLCVANGVTWAKFRDWRGNLQCNGKLKDGSFANHPAPLMAGEEVTDDRPIPF